MGEDHTDTQTTFLQIKTNFESNLNMALRDYNVTADRHSEAVDTIQRTVSAGVSWCWVGVLSSPQGIVWDPLWYWHHNHGIDSPVTVLVVLSHHELVFGRRYWMRWI